MGAFFNADEAAAELQRLTQTSWTAAQVLRAAKAGRLPVCFDFVGELVAHSVDGRLEIGGVSPRVLDFDGVVRSLTQPTADGICGFGVLVEIQEAHRLKFSHEDGKLSRGISLPTEFPHGGCIKAGHKVECWIEDAVVPPGAFLFHADDLNALVSIPKASSIPSTIAPVLAQARDAAPAPVVAASPCCKSSRKRNLLDPVIEAAQKACSNEFDAPAVWAVLLSMAVDKRRPLLGVTEDGIQWTDGNDNPRFLSLKNLRDRLNRSKKRER